MWWWGIFCVQPTVKPQPWKLFLLSAFPDLLFITADGVFIFLWDVKGSKGGEKWRGSLKVRAGFLRCSGGHPATSPGSVYIYIDLWTGPGRRRRKKRETGGQSRQTMTGRDKTLLKRNEKRITYQSLSGSFCLLAAERQKRLPLQSAAVLSDLWLTWQLRQLQWCCCCCCDGQTQTCILTIHHATVLDHAHAEPSPLFYLPPHTQNISFHLV